MGIMEQFFYFWGVNFHKAVKRRTLTMFVSEYHYEQTTYYYSSRRWKVYNDRTRPNPVIGNLY